MAGIQADVDSREMSIYRYLSTTHRRRSLMDAMYWEHPIDLDKIRRLVGWRQMTGGRGGRHRHGPGGPAGPGGFRAGRPGGGVGGPRMGPLFGGMHGGPRVGPRR